MMKACIIGLFSLLFARGSVGVVFCPGDNESLHPEGSQYMYTDEYGWTHNCTCQAPQPICITPPGGHVCNVAGNIYPAGSDFPYFNGVYVCHCPDEIDPQVYYFSITCAVNPETPTRCLDPNNQYRDVGETWIWTDLNDVEFNCVCHSNLSVNCIGTGVTCSDIHNNTILEGETYDHAIEGRNYTCLCAINGTCTDTNPQCKDGDDLYHDIGSTWTWTNSEDVDSICFCHANLTISCQGPSYITCTDIHGNTIQEGDTYDDAFNGRNHTCLCVVNGTCTDNNPQCNQDGEYFDPDETWVYTDANNNIFNCTCYSDLSYSCQGVVTCTAYDGTVVIDGEDYEVKNTNDIVFTCTCNQPNSCVQTEDVCWDSYDNQKRSNGETWTWASPTSGDMSCTCNADHSISCQSV